jgi:hypothetical protein
MMKLKIKQNSVSQFLADIGANYFSETFKMLHFLCAITAGNFLLNVNTSKLPIWKREYYSDFLYSQQNPVIVTIEVSPKDNSVLMYIVQCNLQHGSYK